MCITSVCMYFSTSPTDFVFIVFKFIDIINNFMVHSCCINISNFNDALAEMAAYKQL